MEWTLGIICNVYKCASLLTDSLFEEKNCEEREGKGGEEGFSLSPVPR